MICSSSRLPSLPQMQAAETETERERESLFDPHEKQTSNSEKSTRCRQKQTEKQSKVGCDKDRKGRCKLEAFEVIKTDTK